MKTELLDAYYAGLIDGEGYIGYCSKGKGAGKRYILCVNMTNRALIESMRDHFNIGHVISKKVYKNEKPQWRWQVHGRRGVVLILRRTAKYLRLKRDIIEILLG